MNEDSDTGSRSWKLNVISEHEKLTDKERFYFVSQVVEELYQKLLPPDYDIGLR